jgi:hypothetical protein
MLDLNGVAAAIQIARGTRGGGADADHVRRRLGRTPRCGRASPATLRGASQFEVVGAIRAMASGQAIFGAGISHRMLRKRDQTGQTRQALHRADRSGTPGPELLAAGLSTTAVGTRLGLATKTATPLLDGVRQTRSQQSGRAHRRLPLAWATHRDKSPLATAPRHVSPRDLNPHGVRGGTCTLATTARLDTNPHRLLTCDGCG